MSRRCKITGLTLSSSYKHRRCKCEDCREYKRTAEPIARVLKRNRRWRDAHPEYVCFERMKSRCNNPNSKEHWPHYGGRGIRVLIKSWRDIVAAIGPKPGKGYSIDRINNDGHYEIGNIRWATVKEQNNNRRKRCQSL